MSLPKGEIIKESWKLTGRNLGFLCVAGAPMALMIIAEIGMHVWGEVSKNPHFHPKMAGWIFSLISQIMEMGMIGVSLRVIRGGKPAWSDFTAPYQKFWRLYFVGLASDAPVRVASLWGMLVAPFITLACFFAFDQNLSFGAAFGRSIKWVAGEWWSVFVLCLFLELVSIAGILCFGIGVFVAVPFVWIVQAKIYETLRLRNEATSTMVAE